MTRLDQAIRWWKNHEKNNRINRDNIPVRHFKVLQKHNKIQFHLGITHFSDYYTFNGS